MSQLLIEEPPLQVLPSLAREIGLNEAIMLQQIHYWLQLSTHQFEGKSWMYRSYAEWTNEFTFWSNATIRRTIASLESKGLLISGNFNKLKIDKTKWYTIDYQKLQGVSKPVAQNEQTDCSTCTNGVAQNEQTITREYTENTTEIYKAAEKSETVGMTKAREEIIDYLNKRCGRDFHPDTAKSVQLVNYHLKNGRTVDDFKLVIDTKAKQWLNDPKMSKYLRPITLFDRTKFENYLNESPRASVAKSTGKSVKEFMQFLEGGA